MASSENGKNTRVATASGLEALYTLWGDEVFSDPVFYALSIEEQNELHLIATRSSIGSRRQDKAKELDRSSQNNSIYNQEVEENSKKFEVNWGEIGLLVLMIFFAFSFFLRFW